MQVHICNSSEKIFRQSWLKEHVIDVQSVGAKTQIKFKLSFGEQTLLLKYDDDDDDIHID